MCCQPFYSARKTNRKEQPNEKNFVVWSPKFFSGLAKVFIFFYLFWYLDVVFCFCVLRPDCDLCSPVSHPSRSHVLGPLLHRQLVTANVKNAAGVRFLFIFLQTQFLIQALVTHKHTTSK